jgi:predicted kinase
VTSQPRFIAVAGPPCAGKSTLSRLLAQEIDATRFEVDDVRQRLLPGSDQRVEHRDLAYREMHGAAAAAASPAGTVILDATYTAEPCRQGLAEMVTRSGGVLFVIECHVEPSVAVMRWMSRGVHAAVDLTQTRVATLAHEYPYFRDACALFTPGDRRNALFLAVAYLQGEPLSLEQQAAWCAIGRPREEPSMARRTAPVHARN